MFDCVCTTNILHIWDIGEYFYTGLFPTHDFPQTEIERQKHIMTQIFPYVAHQLWMISITSVECLRKNAEFIRDRLVTTHYCFTCLPIQKKMRKKPQINLFKTKTGQKMVGFSVNHFQIDSVTPLLFLVLAHKFRGTNASSENCSENTFRSLCILWTETVNYCLSNWTIWTSKEVSRNIQNMR